MLGFNYVTFSQALKLKDLGFRDRVCSYFENEKEKLHFDPYGWDFNSSFLTCLSRPSHSQVFDWFENKHKLFVSIVVDRTSYPKFGFEIHSFFGNAKDLASEEWGWHKDEYSEVLYRSRFEAESECVDELISRIF